MKGMKEGILSCLFIVLCQMTNSVLPSEVELRVIVTLEENSLKLKSFIIESPNS